jgi:hypothetical protein
MRHLVWIALIGAAACSDANVAGNYTAAITNRADGCSIGWNVGEMTTGVAVTVMQSDSNVTLTVMGASGLLIGGLLGSNAFTGKVDGDDIDLAITGTSQKTQNTCKFTINGQIRGSLDGDTLQGKVEYRALTNDDATCGSRTGCVSTQDFNAVRAPQ